MEYTQENIVKLAEKSAEKLDFDDLTEVAQIYYIEKYENSRKEFNADAFQHFEKGE